MSLRSKSRADGIGPDSKQWIRSNKYDLEDLPEPGETWQASDLGYDATMILNLRAKDLITRLERDQRQGSTYRTKESAYDYLQECLDSPTGGFLPCKSEGCPANAFTSTSEGIECKRCGTTHERSEVDI